ncbi:CDP-Glycerol:Poly(glycerophosphate) glycerophosphotransferase family [marine gamma proteobacterium HTCC2148]|nr:CDP-Glycerol:Poly(glycerophosphate) glycerophosphotransferase family [marine gamma proteobacterium HTCC2148]
MHEKSRHRVGFLVWNKFQFIQIQNILKKLPEATLIIWIKNELSLKTFRNFGYEYFNIRYVSTSNFKSLDLDFDMIIAQNRQPRGINFKSTKYVMFQYSMAKDLTAYNIRWDLYDFGLVYGRYSSEKLAERCTVFKVGNPRFADYFTGNLDSEVLGFIRNKLDPKKKTIAYLPTWGDLASRELFGQIEGRLRENYNIIEKTHHLSDTGVEINSEYTNLDERFLQFVDDSLYILACADVVLSDYSGVIFDALYTGKPVVLLRDKSIEVNQHKKVSPDSIEILKSDLIGPVVYSSNDLVREIQNQLLKNHKYIEYNSKLVEECFEYKENSVTKVIESLNKILDNDIKNERLNIEKKRDINFEYHSVAKVTPQMNTMKSIRIIKNSLFKIRYAIFKVVVVTLSSSLFPKRHARKVLSLEESILSTHNYFKIIAIILDRSPFQKQISRTILSLDGSSLSGKRLFADLLIEIFYRRQCYTEVVSVYKKQKVNSKLYSASLIKSLVKTDELTYLGFEIEKYLSDTSNVGANLFHVYETAMASVNYPNENRARLRNERIVNPDTKYAVQEAWQGILINNGYLWKIEELEIQGLLTKNVSERIGELKIFQGDLLPYSVIAGLNNCRTLSEKKIVKGVRHLAYNELAERFVVELNIPVSFFFFQNDENTKSVRRDLIQFYIHLIEYFVEHEIPFMPILQFGWNVSPLNRDNYVLSHHTRGGGDKHFHIKTSAVKGFVSFDSDGFAGWASIAKDNLHCRERIEGISSTLSEKTWETAFYTIIAKNSSKYSQPEHEESGYTFKYVFLPLQIAVDLVASLSYITGSDLASFLVEKFAGSEYKVVIKRHPLCRSNETKELLEKLSDEDHVIISKNSVHELIKNASLVVTVNSGVGMEAILHLKNVIITGRADYFYGATLVNSIWDLEKYLDSSDWKKKNDVQLKKFIHFYFNDFLIDVNSGKEVSERIRKIGL